MLTPVKLFFVIIYKIIFNYFRILLNALYRLLRMCMDWRCPDYITLYLYINISNEGITGIITNITRTFHLKN